VHDHHYLEAECATQVKCNSCNEVHPKFVTVNRLQKRDVPGSKGATANFIWKCSFCNRQHIAKFDLSPTREYSDENGDYNPFLVVECRGLEFIGFDPTGTWKCVGSTTGTKFPEVVLEDGQWVDYDEKAALPVGVSNIQSKWSRA